MATPETSLLIGGDRAEGAGEPIEVENPFSEESLATVAAASSEQVDAAVAAARQGFRRGSRRPPPSAPRCSTRSPTTFATAPTSSLR